MPDDTPDLTPLSGTPINDLFFAINHYVSTGDHIGEGVAVDEPGGGYRLFIMHDPGHPDDRSDFRRFASRLAEIGAADPALAFRLEDVGRRGKFRGHSFALREDQCRPLARELLRESGAEGWGTAKPLLDKHFIADRRRLLGGCDGPND